MTRIRRHVELHVADAHHVGVRQVAVDPPQDGADARDELPRAERLREVVVGAELEADELVGLLAHGR